MCLKTAGRVAKNDDPDQTPRYAASDLGLRCLPGRPSRYLRVITGTCTSTKGTCTSTCTSTRATIRDWLYKMSYINLNQLIVRNDKT